MGTIAQEITRIQGAKSDIRTSTNTKLRAQGSQEIPANATIDQYSPFIDAIQQGGSQSNLFDGADFVYLMYKGRFFDNIDDIYNSTRGNLTHWSFSHFNYNIYYKNISSEQFQKLINIIQKFITCGDKNIDLQHTFSCFKITDDTNNITFTPIWSDNVNYLDMKDMFESIKGASGKHVDITIDFSNIYNKILTNRDNNISNVFGFEGTNLDVHIKDLPVNLSNSEIGLGYTGYGDKGAIVDVTVKGAAIYNINASSCTRMTVEKCIDFFNSFDAKTVSRNVTITIPTTLYNQLTEDQKQIITDKGYILASA